MSAQQAGRGQQARLGGRRAGRGSARGGERRRQQAAATAGVTQQVGDLPDLDSDSEEEEEGGSAAGSGRVGRGPVRQSPDHGTGSPVRQLPDAGPAPPVRQLPDPGPGLPPHVQREVAGVQGDQVLLADWIDPPVPGPHPGPVIEDALGWNMIDLWGVWDCVLCEFPTMHNIPRVYREGWASAMEKILRVIESAEEGLELERGLKWFLILPKALFRQGRRGGKAGKGLVARRMNLHVREDWGGLLTLLDRDCRRARMEKQRARQVVQPGQMENREEVQMEKDRKNALLLLSRAHVSKAVRTITSYGIGDMSDPDILQQMEQKYPDRGIPLPASVSRGQCIDNLRGLSDVLLGL